MMTITPNKNAKFIALPRASNSVLAEMPCAMCEELARVKVRADGWIDIRCNKDCGYVESGLAELSFNGLMKSVIDNDQTKFWRTNVEDVRAALELDIVEAVEPDEAIPAQSETPAQDSEFIAEDELEAVEPEIEIEDVDEGDELHAEMFGV